MGKKVLIIVCALPLVLALCASSHPSPVPDTGQTKCYYYSGEIPCPQPGQPVYGQDGNYTINPMSFTKLDNDGNALPDSDTSWAMVRDNVTGFIWEVKPNKDGIMNYSDPHDADNTYTWYDSNPATNGGYAGTPGDGTDTEDFIKALNDANFGGHSDWRLPSGKELLTLVDYSRYNPAINDTYFPNTQASLYWSSTTYAKHTDFAWGVSLIYGSVYEDGKSDGYYVHAVRGKKTQNQFIDNGDGTVTDTSTGLMWQQATAPGTYDWEQALSYCENLALADHSDWRLPTFKELESITDLSRYSPAINTTYFPDTHTSSYRSSTMSTTDASHASSALTLYFYRGDGDCGYANLIPLYVRAARGGQNRLLGSLVILKPAQAGYWGIGSQETITWDTAGIEGNVGISISRDGGKTYEVISSSTPNDGSFPWTVTGHASVNCVLKIEPISEPDQAALQSLFSIFSISLQSGDLDGSGAVDISDAILALQVVSGMTPANVHMGADVNGNGKTGFEEVFFILQKASGLR